MRLHRALRGGPGEPRGQSRTLIALALIAACAACSPDPPSPQAPPPAQSPAQLADYLRGVRAMDPAARARAVASWRLDDAAWEHAIVPAYREAYADYLDRFDALAPAIAAQLGSGSDDIRARRHFSDDPHATGAEIRVRWMLPVLYPSVVATIGDTTIDAVWLPDGDHWHALLGAGDLAVSRAAKLDPACAARLARVTGAKPCVDVSWLVADAAMRGDEATVARACAMTAAQCR